MNKKEALEKVKYSGSDLEDLSDVFKKDKDIVLEAKILLIVDALYELSI